MTITDTKGIAAILGDPARCCLTPPNLARLSGSDAALHAILAVLNR